MVQVYLALVVTNLISGLWLCRPLLKRFPQWENLYAAFDKTYTEVVLGALTFLSGFLGLIFVLPGDQLFLGDLIPSFMALLSGTLLVLNFRPSEPKIENQEVKKSQVKDFFFKHQLIVGIFSLVFGVIHFISPTVIFL